MVSNVYLCDLFFGLDFGFQLPAKFMAGLPDFCGPSKYSVSLLIFNGPCFGLPSISSRLRGGTRTHHPPPSNPTFLSRLRGGTQKLAIDQIPWGFLSRLRGGTLMIAQPVPCAMLSKCRLRGGTRLA